MGMCQASEGTACKELQRINRNYHTSRHSGTEDTQRGSYCWLCVCVRDLQVTLGPWPLCRLTQQCTAVLLPLALNCEHTLTHSFGRLWGESLSYTLKFTRRSSPRLLQCATAVSDCSLRLPVAILCCLFLPGSRLVQVKDSCPSRCDLCQEFVSTVRM